MRAPPRRLRRLAPHLKGASRSTFAPDLIAGATVAAIAVPQGMAYALVAGVPLQMGLWAAALPAAVAALFGSSPYLMTGPTQPVALVLGLSVVGPAVAAGGPAPIESVLSIALLAGAILVALGVLGLGGASRFLSDSVIRGLTVGVGVLIAVSQLPAAAGVETQVARPPAVVPQLWPLLRDAGRALLEIDARSLALALGVPLAVVGLRRLDPRLPGALLALAGAAGAAVLLGWNAGPDPLASLEPPPGIWPAPRVPALPAPGAVGAPALAIALLVAFQSTAAARSLGAPGGEPSDPDRELVGQGAANLTSALLGGIPTSGSFSRSALARRAGARSRLTGVVTGALVLALLPVLGPLLGHVPLAALAGLVILTGLDLVDPFAIRRAATTRGDAAVLAVTLGATLWLDLVQAIYAGLLLSLMLLVRRAGRLQMLEIVRAGPDRLREIALDSRTGTTPVVLLHLEGDLNFAVAAELAERLREIGGRGPRVLVLRLKRARHLDATVIEALRRVVRELQHAGTTVILCGLTDALAGLLERTELARALGSGGLLRTGPRLLEGFERALARARELLHPRGDEQIFRQEEPAAWSYEI